MARESTEGRALGLDWIRNPQWQLSETDYVRMVHKKTSAALVRDLAQRGDITPAAVKSEIAKK